MNFMIKSLRTFNLFECPIFNVMSSVHIQSVVILSVMVVPHVNAKFSGEKVEEVVNTNARFAVTKMSLSKSFATCKGTLTIHFKSKNEVKLFKNFCQNYSCWLSNNEDLLTTK